MSYAPYHMRTLQLNEGHTNLNLCLIAPTDRFVLDNQELVNGIKAEQTTLKGRIDTARDAIDKLTKHKGEEIEKMIDR